jgi:hypothetical protein
MRVPTLVLIAALGLAGCASSAPAATGPGSAASANQAAGVRSLEAARATAQTEFGLLAGGDYGGAWDLWSDQAKQAVSRADFIARSTACPPGKGVMTQVVSTTLVDDNNVDVSWQRAGQTGTARLTYTGGTWHYQPDQATLRSTATPC